MTIYRGLLIFFAVAVLLPCRLEADTKLRTKLEPETVEPGESAIFKVQLVTESGEEIPEEELKLRDDLLYLPNRLTILKKTFYFENKVPTWEYQFTSYFQEDHSIPPVEIQWRAKTFSTERVKLKVSSSRSQFDKELREGFGALNLPYQLPSWLWKVVLCVLFVSLLIYAVMKLLRKIRPLLKKARESKPVLELAPVEDPTQWLRAQLVRLRERLDEEGAEEQIIDELTLVLRTYFAKKTGGPVQAWTTREFERRFTYDQRAVDLCQVFHDCDQYKFRSAQTNARELATISLSVAERTLM